MRNFVLQRCQGGALAVAGLLLGTLGAGAVPITGEIHFAGRFVPIDVNGNSVSLVTSTGIQFNNPSGILHSTGDFAAYVTPDVSLATFTSAFQFNPLTPSPVDPLWSAGGFSFTLTGIEILFQGLRPQDQQQQLLLFGTGYMSGNGYDTTSGSWNFSGQGSGVFSFSADSVASGTAVPDGGQTLILLGMALLGLIFAPRLKAFANA